MKKLSALKKSVNSQNKTDFTNNINEFLPELTRYIKHRLQYYELKNLLPANFYSTSDIVADIYLKIYDVIDQIESDKQLKFQLFKFADEIIQNYIEKENKIETKIPIYKILAEETDVLKEKLTANAEGRPVLVSDLTDEDISYMQKEFKPYIYLFDYDSMVYLSNSLGLNPNDFDDEKLRAFLGSLYGQLPDTTKKIIDLYAFGGFSEDEIAEIIGSDANDVVKIISIIKSNLKS